MIKFGSKGFTLIELLVVVSIIGVLASIVLVTLDGARKKGRDSKRISDLKQIQLALELYYDQKNTFPPGTIINSKQALNPTELTSDGYISVMPTDPSTGANYLYVPYMLTGDAGGSAGAICVGYHLGATLETVGHGILSQDVDISSSAQGGSSSVKPPSGFSICARGGNQPSNDFDGLATGAACGGTVGTPAPSGTETCLDVKP